MAVPGHLAYYDLYLPSTYHSASSVFPVLFTYSANGGGMVDHFRTIAEEKKWIVIGDSQSRNGQDMFRKTHFNRAVMQHALEHLKIDPNRIFVSGMSGAALTSQN